MAELLFFLEVILLIFSTFVFSKTKVYEKTSKSRKKTKKEPEEPEKKFRIPPFNASGPQLIANVSLIFTLIMGLADLIKIMNTDIFHGAFTVIGLIMLLEKICNIIRYNTESRTVKFIGKLLTVTALIELIVFQMPSYRIMHGDYPRMKLPVTQGTITSENTETEDGTGNIKVTGDTASSVEFTGIDKKIGTIRIDVASSTKNPKRLYVNIDATDETSANYRDDIGKMELVTDNNNSRYIPMLLSGKTEKIAFDFKCERSSDMFMIEAVVLNTPIPFDISYLRMFIIIIVSTIVYAVIYSALLSRSYNDNRKFCKCSSVIVMVSAVLIAVLMTVIKTDDSFLKHFKLKEGNQISEELVLAFENHQVSLLTEVPEDLLAMSDPYDTGLRGSEGVSSKWDHVMYNGKYYSYYGVAPVILLFLPYHLITGYFFPTDVAVTLFAIIGLVFLTLTYNAIIKKWFARIPSGCYLSGLLIINLVCGIWFSVGRPLFYEISISSGFAFVTMGAYFLITSNVICKEKTSLIKVLFASLCSAIAVLCRPTLAVYSICTCVYFAKGFQKAGEVLDENGNIKNDRKRRIKYALCALLPFIILGSFQMWYNFVRFGSPFDFGIKYSLTINDFTDSEYHTIFVLIGFFAYLFQFPTIKADYPYVDTWFTYFRASGYYFKDTGQTSGIVWLALPVFAYLLTGKALKKLPDRKSRFNAISLIGLPCVIMPIIIIFSIWESGYAVRYVADFSWQIVTGALIILFFLYQNSENKTLKTLMKYFLAVSVAVAVVLNVSQIFTFTFYEPDYPLMTSRYHNFIEFWR
ncbi:MAG: hypothetical protein K2G36_01005 [Ruminococcus sp.]|nr:hypothetical protein [Ruminococcus sp.]